MGDPRLIVASTRLPVALTQHKGEWSAQASPGGLATALRSVAAQRNFAWIGWPGHNVRSRDQAAVRNVLSKHGVPVFMTPQEHAGFYDFFANGVLWPLLHSLPIPTHFDRNGWKHYQTVNRRFAETIAEVARPGDHIWVHDYQLALVPGFLRSWGLECVLGFFLHIPFPASETFRTLPVREELLQGMLGADLIGFHTYEYVGNFRS